MALAPMRIDPPEIRNVIAGLEATEEQPYWTVEQLWQLCELADLAGCDVVEVRWDRARPMHI